MYCLHEVPKLVLERCAECKVLLSRIAAKIEPSQKQLKISSNAPIEPGEGEGSRLFILRDGAVSVSRDGRVVFVLDEGDLIGFENHFFPTSVELSSEFAIIVDSYVAEDLFQAISEDTELFSAWNSYLAHYSNAITGIISALVHDDSAPNPKFRNFAPGEVIIEEGSFGTEVYNLIEGRAEVFVEGVQVGEILQDEIFGAIGALTGTPRTATVKASSASVALELPKDGFVDMLKTRPNTVQKMLENMARAIVELNQKVVDQSK